MKHAGYNSSVFDYKEVGGSTVIDITTRSKSQYKYNGQEFQDEAGLNMTAMDFRQYDNALGRFHGVDALVELDYSGSPYSFGFNNPVYFSDPSGLTPISELPQYLQAMWYATPNGTNSTWINDGFGNFDNANGSSFISSEGYFFLSSQFDSSSGGIVGSSAGGENSSAVSLNGVILNTVTVYGNSSTWASQIQQHVYDTSPYYGPESSDMNSVSAWAGYAGLHAAKTQGLLLQIATNTANDVSAIKAASYLKTTGHVFGVIGSVATGIEGLQDGHISTGDVAKIAIGLITTFTPYGWVYSVIDLGVGITTGTTLTDRIGYAIDN